MGSTTETAIADLIQQPLTIIRDERGSVMHMLRADSELLSGFGEVYFSTVKQGVIKGWKRHHIMTQHYAVPVGNIRLAVYDDRPASPTRGAVTVIETGVDNYALIKIPPMVWYGFQGLSEPEALIVNCASHGHDPDEVDRRELNDPPHPELLTRLEGQYPA